MGAESGGREELMDGEIPASLAAAMRANGGVDAAKERVLMSMLVRFRRQRVSDGCVARSRL